MKINVDSKNIYNFAEIMSFISREYGLVGMDWTDVQSFFDCNSEMNFYSFEGDTPKDACENLKAILPAKKIKSGLIFFTVNKKAIELTGNEISSSLTEFVNCVFDDDGTFIWNVYETEQQENYKLYVLVAE